MRIRGPGTKRICVWTFRVRSWGPMGPQEVQNSDFGIPGEVLGPYSDLQIRLVTDYRMMGSN